jgi:hypothetical protein
MRQIRCDQCFFAAYILGLPEVCCEDMWSKHTCVN